MNVMSSKYSVVKITMILKHYMCMCSRSNLWNMNDIIEICAVLKEKKSCYLKETNNLKESIKKLNLYCVIVHKKIFTI